jgi:hypothetical protein
VAGGLSFFLVPGAITRQSDGYRRKYRLGLCLTM